MKFIKPLTQVILASVLMILFFILMPWVAARPISQIKNEANITYQNLPENAKSYTISHGTVVFRETGTVSEEPVKFSIFLIIFIIDFVALVLSFPKGMRGRRQKEQNS
ncbi:MAG: hypothetical protein ACREPB_15125 [Arenimonas sp.]